MVFDPVRLVNPNKELEKNMNQNKIAHSAAGSRKAIL